ncbi:hypothetical protein Tco_1536136 [Tanacetum coccineum]
MSSPVRIRIARRQRVLGRATTGASGNSDDGACKMGAVGIFGIEVVGETIGATDMGGGELFDGSASDDK